MAERPMDEMQQHPRISRAFKFKHFDKDINEESVILSL